MEDMLNDVSVETPTVTPEVKKKRTPVKKTAIRSAEELDAVEPHRMSPEEMKAYIKFVREDRDFAVETRNQLKLNCDSAYEILRRVTMERDALQVNAGTKLNYVKGAIKNLNDSVQLILKEEK